MQLIAFIVDDEQHVRNTLQELLHQFCPEVQIKGMAGTIEEALATICVQKVDILFLDVNLGNSITGFDLLDKLRPYAFEVVFVTAHAEHAVKAFEYAAVHYLLKPVSHGMLIDTIDRIKKRKAAGTLTELQQLTSALHSTLTAVPPRISLSDTSKTEFVAMDDIAYLESKGSYTAFHLGDGRQYTRSRNLKYFEDALLEYPRFVRVHKSFIVNKTHIKAYRKSNQYLELLNGTTVPMAIGYRALMAELGDHLII
jgi:two-component system, LytTR family, response regulator